jgi:predicted DNA-binding protein
VIVLRTFKVGREKWTRFCRLAKANERTASAELRTLIDRSLEESEDGRAA